MKWHVIIVVMVALAAYLLYMPFPDGLSDQWGLRMVVAGHRVIKLAVGFSFITGLGSPLNVSRAFRPWLNKVYASWESAESLEIRDMEFDGVKVRIYRPSNTDNKPLPAVMFFHGGGFVTLNVDIYEHTCRYLARETKAVIVSVEYRLAPEYIFPIPVEDCVTATVHLMKNSEKYGVDNKRIAVAGDSAGGNLAAAVSWKLAYNMASQSTPSVKLQVILYPMLQAFDFQLPSYMELEGATGEIISKQNIMLAWCMYIMGKMPNDVNEFYANNHTSFEMKTSKYAEYVSTNLLPAEYRPSSQRIISKNYNEDLASSFQVITNPLFSPLMAKDLSKMPPAYVVTAEYDLLRDDGMLYAKRLQDAGVKVHFKHIKGGYHGMISFNRFEKGAGFGKEVAAFIRENL